MCDYSLQTNARRVTPHRRGRPEYGRVAFVTPIATVCFSFFSSLSVTMVWFHAEKQHLNFLLRLALCRNTGPYCLQQNILNNYNFAYPSQLVKECFYRFKFKSFNFPKYSDIGESLKMSRHLMVIAPRNFQKLQPLYFFQVIFDMIQLYTY